MKKIVIIKILTAFSAGFSALETAGDNTPGTVDYRQEMRDFVQLISKRARQLNNTFIVVPQNALSIGFADQKPSAPIKDYFRAIDGAGCEELYYGLPGTGKRTAADTTKYFLQYLKPVREQNKQVLVIDYVKTRAQAKRSFRLCARYGFVSFQGEKSLTRVPGWKFNYNKQAVSRLSDAKNFLYLLSPRYRSTTSFIRAMRKTDYDLLIIDAFYHGKLLTRQEVSRLKLKRSGRQRLVMAYLSIGEAETYRYYWKKDWKKNPPLFLEKENPDWKNNFKVKYWQAEWQKIICGSASGNGFAESYLKKIIDAGFDGVYLDIIDAAMYFEEKK